MGINFEDFTYPACVILKSVGYDFLDNPRSTLLKLIMRLYLIVSLICFTVVTYHVIIIAINELRAGLPDPGFFYRLLTDINFNVIGLLKCIFFVRHLRRNQQICKIFKELFPKYREERRLYHIREYFWPKWIIWFLYLYLSSIALIAFTPIVGMVINYFIQYFQVGYAEAKFGYVKVYDILYALDHHNPVAYILLYSLEVMNAHFGTAFNICPDLFLVAYVMQLCMHFDHITRKLECYKPLEEQTFKDCNFLGVLIKKHQLILNLSNNLREIYSVLILIMFLSTAVTLCCDAIYVLSQGITRDLIGFLMFLPSTLGQYFIVCYYGQQIINKSSKVCEAAYNSSWYNGSQSYKKSILVILIRSQKEAEFNAGGFQTTNLAAFQVVVGLTYRAFALLKTMFD